MGLADAGGDGDGDLAACEEHSRWLSYDRSIMVSARDFECLVKSFCLLIDLLAGRYGRAEMSPLSLIRQWQDISLN